jgi:hypothetical protein
MFYMEVVANTLQILSVAIVLAIGLIFVTAAVLYVIDRSQTEDAVRRNYPVIGRFRSLFTEPGKFFRQYFFAMDREEMPFNRAQRDWITRASKAQSNTIAFGSTSNLQLPVTPIFVSAAVPPLDEQGPRPSRWKSGPIAGHLL